MNLTNDPDRIELRHLRYFLAVAERLNFHAAADHLDIAQPALSQQVRQLEDRLGATLFRRTTRSVSLTLAGEAFLPRVRHVLEGVHAAAEQARRAQRGQVGTVRIGFVTLAVHGVLGEALRAVSVHNPDLSFDLVEMGTDEQLDAVRTGALDIGLCRPHDRAVWRLASRVVWRGPYMLALPQEHRYAGRKRLRLRELAEEPWVMFARSTQPGLYDRVLAACAAAGFAPRIVQHASQKPTIIALVRAGVGVALIPSFMEASMGPGVVLLPVSGKLPKVELTAVWRREPDAPGSSWSGYEHPGVRALLEHMPEA